MKFYNYGARNSVLNNKKQKEEEIEIMDEGITNENMITLDSLLNQNDKPTIKVEKELTNYPTIAKIQSFNPLPISQIKVGELSTEYDKFLNSIDSKMIYR